MSHYFYLARCSDNSLYSGYCKDINTREAMHNAGKGAKYTRAHLPIEIIYFEEFETLSEALQREAEVKKFTKAKKEALVNTALS
ncbi:MAG: GIY-YIG nuclease family protein [bacterium]|nr:GIY-YIG nuclease family protein [bacterium]MDA1292963.1 GIY-YIG nuclease family protein [bacterium]